MLTMTKETKNPEMTESGNDAQNENNAKLAELIKAVFHNGVTALKMFFDEVTGQVVNQERLGPIFVFQVKNESQQVYACGFFLQELVARFQSGNDPAQWLSSFYFDLMEEEGGKPLPKPPNGEVETKALIDGKLVPHCIESIREEFAPEQVHAGLGIVKEHGPVFEAGFPSIKDGNNVCAVPLQVLLTHWLLNRNPADILIRGLYNIKEKHGSE